MSFLYIQVFTFIKMHLCLFEYFTAEMQPVGGSVVNT